MWKAFRLGERRDFFVSGEALLVQGSHEMFEKEIKGRASTLQMERREVELPKVSKMEKGKKLSVIQDAVSCL